jgi:hypothetical protein
MNIREGYVVTIEDSDTQWVVQLVDKMTCNLVDYRMGIIELQEVPLAEVTSIVSEGEA